MYLHMIPFLLLSRVIRKFLPSQCCCMKLGIMSHACVLRRITVSGGIYLFLLLLDVERKGRAAPDPQGARLVGILTHPYTTAACAAGVVTRTADRDSSRYRYSGNRRTRRQALDCEGN